MLVATKRLSFTNKSSYLFGHVGMSQTNKECRNDCVCSVKNGSANSGVITNDQTIFVDQIEVGRNDVIDDATMNDGRCRRLVERRIRVFSVDAQESEKLCEQFL